MNAKKYYESIESVVRNVARVNSAGIHDLSSTFRMNDEDVTVTVGRDSNPSENDKVITSFPDGEFAQYVKHVCERWMEKMRAEESQTGEGGEA